MPGLSADHQASEDVAKKETLEADVMSSYALKLSVFGLGIVLVTFFIVRQRKNTYEMLKQDEKSTA